MPWDYKLPIYQIPSKPSPQLKVVLDYFDSLTTWDLETLSQLSTPDFTQATLPVSLGIQVRTKEEDIAFLYTFRDSLNSAPLEIIIHDVNETKGKIWVHLTMKTVGIHCFFLFTFGTGRNENLLIDVTEFVDSKVFSGGGGDSDGDGGNSKPQAETPLEALSGSVKTCVKAMAKCYVDILLFVPRNVKYVIDNANH